MAIVFIFSPTSNHLHPLQVGNCDSNSRLVEDEDANVKSGLKRLKTWYNQITVININSDKKEEKEF